LRIDGDLFEVKEKRWFFWGSFIFEIKRRKKTKKKPEIENFS
jgi:hypothetical protein